MKKMERPHDKVATFAAVAVFALAVLIVLDRLFTGIDIVPEDTEKLFWTGLGPVIIGGAAAYFRKESRGPTR